MIYGIDVFTLTGIGAVSMKGIDQFLGYQADIKRVSGALRPRVIWNAKIWKNL